MQTVMLSVRFTPVEAEEIERTAAEVGVTKSDLIRARIRWAVAMERVSDKQDRETERLPMAAE